MIRAVLFDNDGVLVDTEPIYCASYTEALAHFGIAITPEFYYHFWTREGKSVQHFLKEHGYPYDPKEVRAVKDKILFKRLEDLRTIDGVEKKLEELSPLYQLAMVTTSYRNVVEKILDVTGMHKYFSVVVTGNDVTNGKPDPEGFLKAASKLQVMPLECVVVGDAEKDIKAATAGGMRGIAIPNTYTRDHDFSHADRVLPSIRDLTTDIIEGY